MGRGRVKVAICALALACALVAGGPAAAAHAGPLGDLLYQSPGVLPPGVNDYSCKPPQNHPYPVVVVHGTFADMTITTPVIAPLLLRRGYCVFALDYGHRGTGPIEDSAAELRDFVDRVLAATGAPKVSIVGHSQGGMMPRYWIKFLGGADKVDDLVGLSPSNHGTTTPAAQWAGQYADCPACIEQQAGSDFLRNLNTGDQTPAPVSYTVVETRYDEVVTPYYSEFFPPTTDGRVTNVLLQNRCPLDSTDHVGIIYDPVAMQWMLDALAHAGPANPDLRPDCTGASLLD